MLIVNKPTPSRCLDCVTRLSCERYTRALEMADDLEGLRAILPNDKCLIHGELVRCRECKYFVKNTWECSRLCDRFGDEYADARVYPDWFCADGARRDDA